MTERGPLEAIQRRLGIARRVADASLGDVDVSSRDVAEFHNAVIDSLEGQDPFPSPLREFNPTDIAVAHETIVHLLEATGRPAMGNSMVESLKTMLPTIPLDPDTIMAHQTRMQAAKEAENRRYRLKYPREHTMPAGLFDSLQMERFERVETLLSQATHEVFENLGITYKLDQIFRKSKFLESRSMTFQIRASDKKQTIEENDWGNDISDVVFSYEPGRKRGRDRLRTLLGTRVPVLVPYSEYNEEFLTLSVDQAVGFLSDQGHAKYRKLAHFELNGDEINQTNLRNLLTLFVIGHGLTPQS